MTEFQFSPNANAESLRVYPKDDQVSQRDASRSKEIKGKTSPILKKMTRTDVYKTSPIELGRKTATPSNIGFVL